MASTTAAAAAPAPPARHEVVSVTITQNGPLGMKVKRMGSIVAVETVDGTTSSAALAGLQPEDVLCEPNTAGTVPMTFERVVALARSETRPIRFDVKRSTVGGGRLVGVGAGNGPRANGAPPAVGKPRPSPQSALQLWKAQQSSTAAAAAAHPRQSSVTSSCPSLASTSRRTSSVGSASPTMHVDGGYTPPKIGSAPVYAGAATGTPALLTPPPSHGPAHGPSGTSKNGGGRDKKNANASPPGPMAQTSMSGRALKSTLVYIDGQPVLAQNNYEMKGLTYACGSGGATEAPPAKRQKKSVPKQSKPRDPKIAAAEARRVRHNGAIKDRKEKKGAIQKRFVARNLDLISPFLEEKVLFSLQNVHNDEKSCSLPEKKVYVQPEAIQAEMRDYQLLGLSWMVKMHNLGLGMILGDEMGLGKTLQAISLLCHLKETEKYLGPSLVVCPLSVLYSWCNELKKWAPSLKVLRLHSSSEDERMQQRSTFLQSALKFDVVVTTYEMAKSSSLRSLWSRQYFNYLVLDEGHIIKDHSTQISQAVRKMHFENALVLTGTPLQNNLVELWSILSFLLPKVFTASNSFAEAFDITKNVVDKGKLDAAHKMLDLFMLRRLKGEVEKLLPKKIETTVICPLSEMQIFWYKGLLLKDVDLLANASSGDNDEDEADDNSKRKASAVNTFNKLRSLFMQLRKCCNHPFLFDGVEKDIDNTSCKDLIAASGKLAVLDKLLRSLFSKGHRTVLFSQFTIVLDLIEDYCEMRGWRYCRFDGSTPRARRNFLINQFNDSDSDHFIFLMSTRSGGMGINLQTADTCILFDSDWNPQCDLQAQARVHRIGQKKTVHVYRLVAGGTIEERIVERAQKKLFLDQMVNRGTSAALDEETSGLTAADLLSDLKFGADAIFGDSSNALPSNEDIMALIDRNRMGDTSIGKLKGGMTQTAAAFDAKAKLSSTTKFGGVDFAALRNGKMKSNAGPKSIKSIANDWNWFQSAKQGKRKVKKRITMVNGEGSGYGAAVPVLAANCYDLEHGEASVFDRELSGGKPRDVYSVAKKKASPRTFGEQDFCQACGDGGKLLCCPRCPVCVHLECSGEKSEKNFRSCSHHRCTDCGRNTDSAGGILFPCQSCPRSYCEDCLPKEGVRIINECPRFEEMGFISTKQFCYIHCSTQCELVAEKEFAWVPKAKGDKIDCPEEIDVSFAFGKVEVPSTADSKEQKSTKATSTKRLTEEEPIKTAQMGQTEKEGRENGTSGELPSNDISPSAPLFKVGSVVYVARRMWSGMNKEGGVARVTKVHPSDDPMLQTTYDVRYVLGGIEREVSETFLTPGDDDGNGASKRVRKAKEDGRKKVKEAMKYDPTPMQRPAMVRKEEKDVTYIPPAPPSMPTSTSMFQAPKSQLYMHPQAGKADFGGRNHSIQPALLPGVIPAPLGLQGRAFTGPTDAQGSGTGTGPGWRRKPSPTDLIPAPLVDAVSPILKEILVHCLGSEGSGASNADDVASILLLRPGYVLPYGGYRNVALQTRGEHTVNNELLKAELIRRSMMGGWPKDCPGEYRPQCKMWQKDKTVEALIATPFVDPPGYCSPPVAPPQVAVALAESTSVGWSAGSEIPTSSNNGTEILRVSLPQPGTLGILVQREEGGQNFDVIGTTPNSQGAQAGIRKGDTICHVGTSIPFTYSHLLAIGKSGYRPVQFDIHRPVTQISSNAAVLNGVHRPSSI